MQRTKEGNGGPDVRRFDDALRKAAREGRIESALDDVATKIGGTDAFKLRDTLVKAIEENRLRSVLDELASKVGNLDLSGQGKAPKSGPAPSVLSSTAASHALPKQQQQHNRPSPGELQLGQLAAQALVRQQPAEQQRAEPAASDSGSNSGIGSVGFWRGPLRMQSDVAEAQGVGTQRSLAADDTCAESRPRKGAVIDDDSELDRIDFSSARLLYEYGGGQRKLCIVRKDVAEGSGGAEREGGSSGMQKGSVVCLAALKDVKRRHGQLGGGAGASGGTTTAKLCVAAAYFILQEADSEAWHYLRNDTPDMPQAIGDGPMHYLELQCFLIRPSVSLRALRGAERPDGTRLGGVEVVSHETFRMSSEREFVDTWASLMHALCRTGLQPGVGATCMAANMPLQQLQAWKALSMPVVLCPRLGVLLRALGQPLAGPGEPAVVPLAEAERIVRKLVKPVQEAVQGTAPGSGGAAEGGGADAALPPAWSQASPSQLAAMGGGGSNQAKDAQRPGEAVDQDRAKEREGPPQPQAQAWARRVEAAPVRAAAGERPATARGPRVRPEADAAPPRWGAGTARILRYKGQAAIPREPQAQPAAAGAAVGAAAAGGAARPGAAGPAARPQIGGGAFPAPGAGAGRPRDDPLRSSNASESAFGASRGAQAGGAGAARGGVQVRGDGGRGGDAQAPQSRPGTAPAGGPAPDPGAAAGSRPLAPIRERPAGAAAAAGKAAGAKPMWRR